MVASDWHTFVHICLALRPLIYIPKRFLVLALHSYPPSHFILAFFERRLLSSRLPRYNPTRAHLHEISPRFVHQRRRTTDRYAVFRERSRRLDDTMSESDDIYTGDDVGISYPKDGSDEGTEAGASGHDSGGGISQGAMIAIIVVVVTVSVIGSASSQLLFPLSFIPD